MMPTGSSPIQGPSRSPSLGPSSSPLIVAKTPTGSPLLGPVDETLQAVPIDDVNFELLEESAFSMEGRLTADGDPTATPGKGEPAYVMPTTPSPFLHSSFPPAVVPPFDLQGGFGGYGVQGMGMPPSAYDGDHQASLENMYAMQAASAMEGAFPQEGMDGQYMQEMQSQYMEGMQGMYMPEMYDPNFAQGMTPEMYMNYGWAPVMVDGSGNAVDPSDHMNGIPTFNPSEAMLEAQQPQDDGDRQPEAAERRGGQSRREREAEADAAPAERPKEGRRGKGRARDQEKEKPEGKAARDDQANPDGIPKGEFTTVMLRNIPNKYTREMLVKQLQVDFKGRFDFMYLPIDFKNKCNVGYGFINFRNEEACRSFVKNFNGVDVSKCLPGLNSKKVAEVTPARVQGLNENVRRLRNSPVMNQLIDHPEWMPLMFNERGQQEQFPQPDQPLPPVKPRRRAPEGAVGDD